MSAAPPADPIPRVGGRVLLLDTADRVLLIHERLEDGSTHWLTPGGGVEDAEQPSAAAQREAFEETGIEIVLPPAAEPVLVTRRLWSWGERVYDQVDSFFLARVPAGTAARPNRLTPVERQIWLGLRWWDLAELRSTDAVLLPPELPQVLADLLAQGVDGTAPR